jgi:hypothetical protein
MGWSHGVNSDGREVGYGVEATCDHEGCEAKIDRGLAYCCGAMHTGMRDEDRPGCGGYFCPNHLTLGQLCDSCAASPTWGPSASE